MKLDKFELVETIIGLQTAALIINDEPKTKYRSEWLAVLDDLVTKFQLEYEKRKHENI